MDAEAPPSSPRHGAGTRWRPRAEAVAGALGTLGVSLVAVSLLVWASRGFEPLPASFARSPWSYGPLQATALLYIVVGALLVARVPRNPAGWLLLAMGLVVSLILPVNLLIADAHEAFRPPPPTTALAAWLLSSFSTPALAGLGAVAGLVFPDGRFISPAWRRVAALTVLAVAGLGLSVGLDPSGLVWYPSLPNPLAAPEALEPVLTAAQLVSSVMLMVAIGAIVASLMIRYRQGDSVTRAQLRWVIYAATIQALAMIPLLVTRYMVPVGDALGEALTGLAQVGAMALPVAAAFAITRYRLFGIDALIGRTLVYVPLMGVLGGLYALAVTVFQRVFIALTGGTSDAALLIAVFLTAAAFTPLRKALEGAVERWTGAERPAPGATATPGPDPDELMRVTAAVIALRRLEERLASGDPGGEASGGSQRSLSIDSTGQVSCPNGPRVSLSTCLGCPHLVGLSTAPPRVACAMPDTLP